MLLTYYCNQVCADYSVIRLWPSLCYKQLKKAQMSGHVKPSPGPQNTLRPQRVNEAEM